MEKIQQLFKQENNAENSPLICAICKHYLSISPIVHNDRLGSICGREICKKWAASEGTNYRQSAYEELAKFLEFPCMYKEDGCKEVLPWNEIGEHEIICEFMKLCCPFSTDYFEDTGEICTWEGNASEILLHMEENHLSHSFEKYVQISLEQDIKKNKLMFSRIEDSIVILLVVINAESDTYWKVWTVPEIWKNFHYKIEITSEKGQSLSRSKLQTAEILHPNFMKLKIDNSWLKINFESIKNFFDSPYFLTTTFYVKGFLIGSPENLSCHDISSSLPITKCDRCGNHRKSMFFCRGYEEVHTICDNCRYCGQYCPECPSKSMNLYTNFAAANFDALLNQSFKSCIFCEERIQCLSSHLSESHSKNIFKLGECHNFRLKYYLFSFGDHIFLLSRIYQTSGNLKFSVQCLETRTLKYKYELKLMNSKTSSTAITFTNFCHPALVDLKYITGQNLDGCTHETLLPWSLYTSIFPHVDSIVFKLNIFKI